jgi:transposase
VLPSTDSDAGARRRKGHTSCTKRSTDFIAFLEKLDNLYGPKPGVGVKPVVIVLDNGPIHTSKATRKALAARDHWLRVEWLPQYAPELNDIVNVWAKLKALHLAHLTFDSRQALDCTIHSAVKELNLRKSVIPLAKPRMSA